MESTWLGEMMFLPIHNQFLLFAERCVLQLNLLVQKQFQMIHLNHLPLLRLHRELPQAKSLQ